MHPHLELVSLEKGLAERAIERAAKGAVEM
jgi:hypothetical protein